MMWGVSQNNKMQYFGATVTVGLKKKMKMYANSHEKMKKQVAVVSNGENVGGVFCGMLAFT